MEWVQGSSDQAIKRAQRLASCLSAKHVALLLNSAQAKESRSHRHTDNVPFAFRLSLLCSYSEVTGYQMHSIDVSKSERIFQACIRQGMMFVH